MRMKAIKIIRGNSVCPDVLKFGNKWNDYTYNFEITENYDSTHITITRPFSSKDIVMTKEEAGLLRDSLSHFLK